jgi:hypothetical protein
VVLIGLTYFFVPDLRNGLSAEIAPTASLIASTPESVAESGTTADLEPDLEGDGGVEEGETIPGIETSATTGQAEAAITTSPPITSVEKLVQLLVPENETILSQGNSVFRWQFDAELLEGEALELIIWPEKSGPDGWKDGVSAAGMYRESRTFPLWDVGVDFLGLDRLYGDSFVAGDYFWGVARVSMLPYERIQLESSVRLLSYISPYTGTIQAPAAMGCEGALCTGR